jgi:hypothetical protein
LHFCPAYFLGEIAETSLKLQACALGKERRGNFLGEIAEASLKLADHTAAV